MLCLVLAACGPASAGSGDGADADAVYSIVFTEVLDRGEEWWGQPPPGEYCLGIAPDEMVPSLEESRDPSREVLERVARARPDRTFHPASRCIGGEDPRGGPSATAAGFLWVAPLDVSDGSTLRGEWSAYRAGVIWECSFDEGEQGVELGECRKVAES